MDVLPALTLKDTAPPEAVVLRGERRARPRTQAILAVALSSESKEHRHGVTRDLSSLGLLVVTPTRFRAGERVMLRLHAGSIGVDVGGRVARVEENAVSSPELWRWRIGIALEETLPLDLLEQGLRASKEASRAAGRTVG